MLKMEIKEIVPVESDSEDEDYIIQTNIRSLPISNRFCSNMIGTSGALMKSKKSSRQLQDNSGRA